MRLSCAMVIPCCVNANAAAGVDLDVRDASCLVCHRLFGGGDNSWDMVARLWLLECFLQHLLPNESFM